MQKGARSVGKLQNEYSPFSLQLLSRTVTPGPMAPGPIVSGRPGPLSVEPGPIVSGPRGHRQWDPGPSSENHVAIVSETLVFVSAEGPEAVTGLRVVGSPQGIICIMRIIRIIAS